MKEDGDDIEIHKKEWGAEHWIVNENYCGKKLILRRGYRCSIHKHKIKDETFYVIKGRVLMEINGAYKVLEVGDKQRIEVGTYHRFTGLTNSEIIEFSTKHYENDSYRIHPSGKVPNGDFKQLLKVFA